MIYRHRNGLLHVALASCLALIASGCSGTCPPSVSIEPQIPRQYLEPTSNPADPGPSTEDALAYCKQTREGLEACNLDKAAINTLLKR